LEVEHIETRQEPLEEHHAGDPDRVHDGPHECDQYHQEADAYYKMGASVNIMLESNYFKLQSFSSSFSI
jgi:hypothetical protein